MSPMFVAAAIFLVFVLYALFFSGPRKPKSWSGEITKASSAAAMREERIRLLTLPPVVDLLDTDVRTSDGSCVMIGYVSISNNSIGEAGSINRKYKVMVVAVSLHDREQGPMVNGLQFKLLDVQNIFLNDIREGTRLPFKLRFDVPCPSKWAWSADITTTLP